VSVGDPVPDGSHGPHVLVEDVRKPELADEDRHHLERVLRVRVGDRITVGDGAGRWCPCRLGPEPEPVGEVREVVRPEPELTVGFALIKGGRPELVVQKLTELGIDRIVPFVAARSVVRWDTDKAMRNAERLRRVAREAVMQCRRAWLPQVESIQTFAALVARPGVAMADRGGKPLGIDTPTVIIGPEGGWDQEEAQSDVPRVALSDAVLRAETAAIAAAALLGARRSELC
jgi:16S rRNA (uracil1498-N3)-methyltransferase